ncbi:MAG: hypothetical protein QNK23_02970 [Crocinitomicaceae bacterium]|nr:hypothetical protein [Crocinitomicaceae bacterium]
MMKLLQKHNHSELRYLLLVTILFFGLSQSAYSQVTSLNNEAQLIEYLGQEKYNEFTQSNPSYINFLDVRCSSGYVMMDYVEEKMNEFPVIEIIYHSSLEIVITEGKEYLERIESKISPEEFVLAVESPEFNFLEYKFSFDRSKITYHVLGNTGKVIMIFPVEKINKLVNARI